MLTTAGTATHIDCGRKPSRIGTSIQDADVVISCSQHHPVLHQKQLVSAQELVRCNRTALSYHENCRLSRSGKWVRRYPHLSSDAYCASAVLALAIVVGHLSCGKCSGASHTPSVYTHYANAHTLSA